VTTDVQSCTVEPDGSTFFEQPRRPRIRERLPVDSAAIRNELIASGALTPAAYEGQHFEAIRRARMGNAP
jgi:hypothetical protein